jgi:hypothetical protein
MRRVGEHRREKSQALDKQGLEKIFGRNSVFTSHLLHCIADPCVHCLAQVILKWTLHFRGDVLSLLNRAGNNVQVHKCPHHRVAAGEMRILFCVQGPLAQAETSELGSRRQPPLCALLNGARTRPRGKKILEL